MAQPPLHPAAELLLGLTKPCSAVSKDQRWESDVACEAAKRVFLEGVRGLVEDAQGFPVLTSKSCDGTPMSLVHRSKRSLPSGSAVKTSGRQGTEWLVKNQFVRTRTPAGDWLTRALIAEQTMMIHGKTVAAILSVAMKEWQRLRSLGHWGCSIEHYVFDRAGLSALDRVHRQWHPDTPFVNLPADLTPEMARLT